MGFSSTLLRAVGVVSIFVTLQAASCSDPTSDENVQSIFTVPASLDELAGMKFFDMPFPCDLRIVNGGVKFSGYPNPKNVMILDSYAKFIDGKLDGFSPVAAGYLRFTGPLDATSLPKDPAASLTDGSAVKLIDITQGSPDYQKQLPINVYYQKDAGVYWPANTLTFMPAVGYPLRPHTTYAVVVSDGLRSGSGLPVNASADVLEMLGTSTPSSSQHQTAREKLAPFVTEMNYVVDLKRVVHFTIFTTNDPTAEYLAAAKALPKAAMAPTADPTQWKLKQSTTGFDEYVGMYGPSPNYQAGTIPFTNFGDGGGFQDDANGVPQVQNTFNLRFSLSVPNATKCPIPTTGYPIVMYAHGTGGDYESYVQDGTAKSLTGKCLAVMGVDQIFHGTRPGAPMDSDPAQLETHEEILFFNFNNIEAARTNVRQSGLDEVQRARLFTESKMVVPAAVSKTMMDIPFDATKLMFFGHSQGSLNGPLFLSASAEARGAVLSGASGLISVTLLDKTSPSPSVADLVKTLFLELNDTESAELSLYHPGISFVQSIVDTVDPINYARFIITKPVVGVPKSVYQTEGIRADGTGDTYAPPRGIEALGLALGLDMQNPVIHQPADATWKGAALQPVTVPATGLSGNLAGGKASGILAQWDPGKGEGHFVVFQVPQATAQSAGFLRNLADNPVGLIPAP